MRKKAIALLIVSFGLFGLFGHFLSLTVHAAEHPLPVSSTVKEYIGGIKDSEETITYKYNKKNLASNYKASGKIMDADEGGWQKYSSTLIKPEFKFYTNGKLKQISNHIPWVDRNYLLEAYYNKKGYITKRISSSHTYFYKYKSGKLFKIKEVYLLEGDPCENIGTVKYTYYKNKQVKTMQVFLISWGMNKIWFDKNGYLVKNVNKSARHRKYVIKYTLKNECVTKMKVFRDGELFRIWTFKYGKPSGTLRQYRSMINSIAGSLAFNQGGSEIIDLFNLDNGYKNVF